MCGAVLSKFKKPGNKVAPTRATRNRKVFSYLKRNQLEKKLRDETRLIGELSTREKHSQSNEDSDEISSLSTENAESESGLERSSEGEMKSKIERIKNESETSTGSEEEAEVRALDSAVVILSAQRPKDLKLLSVDRAMRAMESAKEILAAQMESADSSSSTVLSQPLSATRSVFVEKSKNAIAFEVRVGKRPTVPSARVPRRLRKLENQPSPSTEEVNAELLAAEEKRLQGLESFGACAGPCDCGSQDNGANSTEVNTETLADKKAGAERKRNEESERKKQAGACSPSCDRRSQDNGAHLTEVNTETLADKQASAGRKREEEMERKMQAVACAHLCDRGSQDNGARPGEVTAEVLADKQAGAEMKREEEIAKKIQAGACAHLCDPGSQDNGAHPGDVTAEVLADKQAEAERKRNEELERKEQVAEAQAFSKTERQSAIVNKLKKTEQMEEEHEQKTDSQKGARETRAKRVKENIEEVLKEEESEVLADLQELETDKTYYASDSDASWGDDHKNTHVYEWEDFFDG